MVSELMFAFGRGMYSSIQSAAGYLPSPYSAWESFRGTGDGSVPALVPGSPGAAEVRCGARSVRDQQEWQNI